MPSRIKRSSPKPKPETPKRGVIPPHVWVVEAHRRRKRPPYVRPGLSPLRHSFTSEDLLQEAAEGVTYPRYSNPYNNENCHYHYLFPPGSLYASWNPRLGHDFWVQTGQDAGKHGRTKFHYIFPPGSPYESWNPKPAVYAWNLGPLDGRLSRLAGKAVVRSDVAENK